MSKSNSKKKLFKHTFYQLFIIAVLTSSFSVASADEDIAQLLNKVKQTLETGNYRGTFVFMHNDTVETMYIVHGNTPDGIQEKLVSLSGNAQEVIRNDGVLTCILPKKKLVVVESTRGSHGIPSSLPEDLSELTYHYKLKVMGNSRIAGFSCKRIRFEPLDEFRYGHELCINTRIGMLLKSKTFDSTQKAIESMMFTSFRMLSSVPMSLFEPSIDLRDYKWKTAKVEQNEGLPPDSGWKIENLPPGFSLQSVSRRLMSASQKPVQHMVLTDGLASVSVFIKQVEEQQNAYKGAHSKGVMNTYARDINQHQITVVGEVPVDTVKMIGSSISYSAQ